MGTVYRIDDLHPEKPVKKKDAICHCDVRRAARKVITHELAELRRRVSKPDVLCLEDLKSGIPSISGGWDLISSCGLLCNLPSVAASQVVKTAVSRLKPGGRLLMANLSFGLAVQTCDQCRSAGKNQRGEEEMADLTRGVSLAMISGQIIFRDPTGLNIFLELHRTYTPAPAGRKKTA